MALAVNSFGRGEIKVMIKALSAEAFTRVRLIWRVAQAVIAPSPPQFVCRSENETRTLAVTGLSWTDAREIEPGVQLSGGPAAETIITLGAAPPFAHAVEMTLRLKYLRLTPMFGMQ